MRACVRACVQQCDIILVVVVDECVVVAVVLVIWEAVMLFPEMIMPVFGKLRKKKEWVSACVRAALLLCDTIFLILVVVVDECVVVAVVVVIAEAILLSANFLTIWPVFESCTKKNNDKEHSLALNFWKFSCAGFTT